MTVLLQPQLALARALSSSSFQDSNFVVASSILFMLGRWQARDVALVCHACLRRDGTELLQAWRGDIFFAVQWAVATLFVPSFLQGWALQYTLFTSGLLGLIKAATHWEWPTYQRVFLGEEAADGREHTE